MLPFMFKMCDHCFELVSFFRADAGEGNSKRLSVHPSDGDLIDPKGPIKSRHMEPALKGASRHHEHVTFDLAPPDRNVERPALAFFVCAGKCTAQLCCKARLDAPFPGWLFAGHPLNGLWLE